MHRKVLRVMTPVDLESLLCNAAKAIGEEFVSMDEWGERSLLRGRGGELFRMWYPQTDDRDSVELCDKLRIDISHFSNSVMALSNCANGVTTLPIGKDFVSATIIDGDRSAARRLAVLRVAAMIGEEAA